MGNVLILDDNTTHRSALERRAIDRGYHTIATGDVNNARGWLKRDTFEVVFVSSTLPIAQQQELAGLLWQVSPGSPFVVYSHDDSGDMSGREIKLYGADLVRGPDADTKLDAFLDDRAKPVDRNTFRIMVVEDLDSPRDIICAYLDGLGYPEVVGKSMAQDALNELQQHPEAYSCILTDIRMPQISGKELIEFVRRDSRLQHLPIIVLTAYGTVDTLVDCLKAGASGFLVKPPKKNDLMRELARAYRIVSRETSPRLATQQEADQLREVLIKRGFA